MSTDKNFDKIAKYLSDNMVSEEREDFFAWVEKDADNKKLLDDSMEIWETAEADADDFDIDMSAAWGDMDAKLAGKRNITEAEQTLEVVSYIRPILRVAAVGILLLMAAVWYRDSVSGPLEEVVITQPAENTTIELPDGSTVWLNENSELKYHKHFEDRVVHLVGEAFFEVAKKDGASFEIHADHSVTTVLGTKFNVRAYPEEDFVEVMVEEGKVLFESEQQKESKAILTENEYATFTKQTEIVQKASNTQTNATAWKNKELDFSDGKMDQTIAAIERYFNIEIEVTNPTILNCSWVHGKIPNPELQTILEQIKYGSSNAYSFKRIGDKKYTLSGNGCE